MDDITLHFDTDLISAKELADDLDFFIFVEELYYEKRV
jgi:hypothetical protein